MSTVEKTALVSHANGIFRTTCEVLDTPDPDNKIFRFKDGCTWGSAYSPYPKPKPRQITFVSIFSLWKSEFEVGEKEGRYRITRVLEPTDGYSVVLEGTTKPEVQPTAAPVEDTRCELAILAALESEPRITLRDLRRKVHAYRYPSFHACLKRLHIEGKLQILAERGLTDKERTWIITSDCISGTNENGACDVGEQ